MIRTDLEKAVSFPMSSAATLQVAALQASAPIVLLLTECDEELRAEAIELFKQLATGELDEEQRFATVALLAEILFPNGDSKGYAGVGSRGGRSDRLIHRSGSERHSGSDGQGRILLRGSDVRADGGQGNDSGGAGRRRSASVSRPSP